MIQRVAAGNLPAVKVYGDDWSTPDGTSIRDYIHIQDLCKGYMNALDKQKKDGLRGWSAFNIATGKGTSVYEMIK
jgi:UDP-glucose 4-epimerase